MPEPISNSPRPEEGPIERVPWVGIALTVPLLVLWLTAVVGAPWLAPEIAGFVNTLDLRYGFTAPISEGE